MDWTTSISDWMKQHPTESALIVGGVAAASAAGFVLTSVDLNTQWPAILILLGVGLLIMLLGAVLAISWVRMLLGGFLIVSALVWAGLFGYSKLTPDDQRARCLVYFWQDCKGVADIAAAQAVADEQLKTTTAAGQLAKGSYLVFMQFAGDITRDSIRETMRALSSEGWNVQGTEGGGQRTTAAAGLSEIRYGRPEDAAAAQALATDLAARDTMDRTYTPKLVAGIEPNNLEIWLSR